MHSKSKVNSKNWRLNFLLTIYSLAIVVFLTRLFAIQVLKHGTYTAQAQNQYWNLSVIPARRGDIISSDDFVLAGTQTHYLMYIEPKKVAEPVKTAHELADYLANRQTAKLAVVGDETKTKDELEYDRAFYFGENYDRILQNINSDLYWVIVEHNITPLEKEAIEALKLAGVGFEEEPVRYYPEKNLCSHVLGFVAFNEQGEKQGYFGIEGALDGDLKGKPGRVLEELDALGNPILIGDYKKAEPIRGRDIVLTINRTIQYIVEKGLKDGVEKYDARSGNVIVMDPFTGEVLALANYPTYQPDDFDYEQEDEKSHRKEEERKNLAISQTYEPGSVMKPFTISSAIDLGLVNPSTTFEDRGPVQYSDYVIDNWDGKHHGIQTITQLLEKSNNIGASWVGHLVGRESLARYLSEFGFGHKSEIELEGEDTGAIRDPGNWTEIDLATVSFGQGISATPLQVLNGFNVIANGGFLIQPKIIQKIIDDQKVIDMPTKQIKRVISKETAGTLTDMLISATESGEAKYFVMKNYKIAGKTGTAQIPFEGKYDPERTNATFVGYVAGSKRFSMIVRLEEPRASIYAAETSVPLWMGIANELIKYYGLPPDKI